jgi:Fasciclin domain/Transglutaminase-like superfamily
MIETLSKDGRFGLWSKRLQESGGAGQLVALAPLTMFVPTDAAIAKLSRSDQKWFQQDNLPVLFGNHVLRGAFSLDALLAKPQQRLDGSTVTIVKKGSTFALGTATVGAALVTSEGILYPIDQVLLPGDSMRSIPFPTPVKLSFETKPDANMPAIARTSEGGMFAKTFKLDAVIAGATTDFERVQRITKWAHDRFPHDGSHNEPGLSASKVLDGAVKGGEYACTEFGKVVSVALNAVGIPARRLGLRTSDVETRSTSAGHVLAETYLRDQKQWIIIDAQFDAIPTVKGKPVNAVQLQNAIVSKEPSLKILTRSAKEYGQGADTIDKVWLGFVTPYLYFFEVSTLANTWDQSLQASMNAAGKPVAINLVPNGAAAPKRFQGQPINDVVYTTHSIAAFYQSPK